MTPEEIGAHVLEYTAVVSAALGVWAAIVRFTPSHIKANVGYWAKYACQYLTLARIDITLVVTATPPAGPVSVGEFAGRSKQAIAGVGYKPNAGLDHITFSMTVGQSTPSEPDSQPRTLDATLNIISDDMDGDLIAHDIKIRIHHQCTLRDIDSCLLDLSGTLDLINPIIDSLGAKRVAEMCLECKLAKMPNVQIMLKAMQRKSMQVQLADGRVFELTANTIRYYTQEFHGDINKFLKRMIVAYA